MIAVQVGENRTLPHRHALAAEEVRFRHRAAGVGGEPVAADRELAVVRAAVPLVGVES